MLCRPYFKCSICIISTWFLYLFFLDYKAFKCHYFLLDLAVCLKYLVWNQNIFPFFSFQIIDSRCIFVTDCAMIVERLNILISLIFPVTVAIVSVNYPKLLLLLIQKKNNLTRVKNSERSAARQTHSWWIRGARDLLPGRCEDFLISRESRSSQHPQWGHGPGTGCLCHSHCDHHWVWMWPSCY